jgi:hypothetical protein
MCDPDECGQQASRADRRACGARLLSLLSLANGVRLRCSSFPNLFHPVVKVAGSTVRFRQLERSCFSVSAVLVFVLRRMVEVRYKSGGTGILACASSCTARSDGATFLRAACGGRRVKRDRGPQSAGPGGPVSRLSPMWGLPTDGTPSASGASVGEGYS